MIDRQALIDEYIDACTNCGGRPALEQPITEAMMCERCQGNGEIVIDWDRYLHPHDGDVGDEAVAECPDCDGRGGTDAFE